MKYLVIAALMAFIGTPALAGEPAKGAKGAKAAEDKPALSVEKAEDTVILTDGTKIVGTIVAVGSKMLIMIEKDATAERSIEREKVESYSYGKGLGQSTAYKTAVEPDQGLPVISEEYSGSDEGEGPKAPAAPDAGKNPPDQNKQPKGPKGPDAGKTSDLSKLWELLGGNPSVDQLKGAIAEHPAWKGRIREMMRTGQVPAEGAAAAAAFMARLQKEPELRKALDELLGQGKLQPGAGETPKGQGHGQGQGTPAPRRGQEDKPAAGAKEGA